MRRLGPAALAAVLLAACGGPLLYAELEIPELRVTLPPQSFPAAASPLPSNWCNPSVPQPNPPCLAVGASYDLAAHVPAFTQSGATYEVRLTAVSFKLSATQSTPGAPTDLSGIQSARVLVGANPSVPGSGTVVASYVRTTTSPPPTTLAVTGNSNLDLAPYLSNGQLPVRVEVVIDGSTAAFDANISATFYVRITFDWGKYV